MASDRVISSKVDTLSVRDLDLHQRRFTNASPSQDPYDYVVRKELTDALKGLTAGKEGLSVQKNLTIISGLSTLVLGWVVLTPSGSDVTPDISLGLNFKVVLTGTPAVINFLPAIGGITNGTKIWLYVVQDGTGGWDNPTFDLTAYGSDVVEKVISGNPNSINVYQITFHDDSLFHIDFFTQGQ